MTKNEIIDAGKISFTEAQDKCEIKCVKEIFGKIAYHQAEIVRLNELLDDYKNGKTVLSKWDTAGNLIMREI